ncbi:MAG: hypothetical protein WCO60_03505 [Verrucomicrobiota bacterium]
MYSSKNGRSRFVSVMNMSSCRVFLSVCLCGILVPVSNDLRAAEVVPLLLWDVQTTHSSNSQLRESGRGMGKQALSTQQGTVLRRFSIGNEGWYFGAGLQGESFSFSGNNKSGLRHLRDVTAQISLEYFVGETQAASLSFKPGFYFEDNVRAGAFDMPVQLVGGIPLTANLNGVIGAAGARFYKQPIPIVGLSWTVLPTVRLDAVFPEPALTYSPDKALEIKLGGELQSGGFRMDSGTPLEYYSYQIKTRVSYSVTRVLKFSGAVGYELERSFDYFHRGRRETSDGAILFQVGAGLSF